MTLVVVDVMRHAITNHRGLQDGPVLEPHLTPTISEIRRCWKSLANVLSVQDGSVGVRRAGSLFTLRHEAFRR